jgi:hypothetical protein
MSGWGCGDEGGDGQAESHLDEHASTVRQCLQAIARKGPGNHIPVLDGRPWLGDVTWEPLPLIARIQELCPTLLDGPARLTWHEWKGIRARVENHHGTIRSEALRGVRVLDYWLVINNEGMQEILNRQQGREGEGDDGEGS